MSRERAQRRAERLAVQEKVKAARERRQARKARRRALARRLTPRLPDRRTGRLYARRTRAERITVAIAAAVVLAAIWYYIGDLGARIALTALVVVAAPALIVLSFDRRN